MSVAEINRAVQGSGQNEERQGCPGDLGRIKNVRAVQGIWTE
jgi:hypothetical protein